MPKRFLPRTTQREQSFRKMEACARQPARCRAMRVTVAGWKPALPVPRARSPRSQMWRGWKPHLPFFRGLEARAPRRRARSGVCAICGQLPSTVKRTSRETCDELRARQRDRRCRGRDFTCDSAVPLHRQVLAPPRFPRFDLISSACCGRIRGRCTEGWRSGRSRRS